MQDFMKKQLAPVQVVMLFHAFLFLLRPFLHRYTTVGIGMGCPTRNALTALLREAQPVEDIKNQKSPSDATEDFTTCQTVTTT
jgi:hypothetical protein